MEMVLLLLAASILLIWSYTTGEGNKPLPGISSIELGEPLVKE
jgi:hypothetical protein